MSDTKRLFLSGFIALLVTCNTTVANEYPAPPGHYGQDKILKNSTFNTGKGSPYITILPADQASTGTAAKTQKSVHQQKQPTDNTALIIEKPEAPVIQQPETSRPVKQPAWTSIEVTPPTKPAQTSMQPTYEPAPETAPSRFQSYMTEHPLQNERYPDAQALSHYYKQSRQLPFGQWGEEIPAQQPVESPNNDFNLNMPQQNQRFDYPQTQSTGHSPAPVNQPFQGSPDLAAKMFNQPSYPAPARNMAPSNNNGYMNPGSFPTKMMDQMWGTNNMGSFMPPINNQLKSFDQFPVPQNFYGPTTISQPGYTGGNTQYFRQIPKEEIIYPPHYPGNR